MMSNHLARFLRNLSLDAGLRVAFENDPEAILADTDLTDAEKDLLRSADRGRLLAETQLDPLPSTNF